jgi:acetylcholinesterase
LLLFIHSFVGLKVDPYKLVDEQWVSRGILQFPFLPVVDGKFLVESPDLILDHRTFKPCPILIGSNLDEGSYFLIYELNDRLTAEKKGETRRGLEIPPGDRDIFTRDHFLQTVNTLFFYYPQYRVELNSSFGREAIAFQYTDWTALSQDDSLANVNGLDHAVGDSNFVCPLNRFAMAYAQAGLPVYMYYFTHRYTNNPWPQWMGVMHGDEILFTFGQALRDPEDLGGPSKWKIMYTEEEKRLSRRMMRYWSNFAKTG